MSVSHLNCACKACGQTHMTSRCKILGSQLYF